MATAAAISDDKLEIRNGVVRHLIVILMGLCVFVTGICAAFAPLPYAENELFMRVGMGYICTPLSVVLIGYNVYRIATRRCAVRIDERGITDYSTALSSGFTPWDEIQEVYLLRLKSDDFLCAVPADYTTWFSRLGKRQRSLAAANVDAGFAPIRIQFRKVSDTVTSKDAVAFVKKIKPKLVTRIRKPRY